jgi:hypothetical protein
LREIFLSGVFRDSPYQVLELLELLHSIIFDAGCRQNRDDRRDSPSDWRCALVEVPRVVRLAGTSPRRYLDPKRELLVLFPAGDLHSDQRYPHTIELAVSAVNARRK